jgi:2-phosphoglycerate kinase
MEEVPMKLQFSDVDGPYPIAVVRGRLRLCGLTHAQVSEVLTEVDQKLQSFERPGLADLMKIVHDLLDTYNHTVRKDFETLTDYEVLRRDSQDISPLVVLIGGASATGKSIIALELSNNLIATRFISSDTVRLVLRSIMNRETHPELFCHTYQAHVHRQVGPEDLSPILRGYLAQCEIVTPQIKRITENILSEGAMGVVEGVHLLPGDSQNLGPGVVELIIHPDEPTHKSMFMNKLEAEKLRTVSEDFKTRETEFEGTREIQEYLLKIAQDAKVEVVEMSNFDDANIEVSKIILNSVRKLVSDCKSAQNQ